MLVIYLSSLIRSVIALHNLINNKVTCPLLKTQFYDLLQVAILFVLKYAFGIHLVFRCWTKNMRKQKMQSQLQSLLLAEADFWVSDIKELYPFGLNGNSS